MENISARDPLTERVIGLAIGVHRELGPGLLESAYEECLCFELKQARIGYSRQQPLAIMYKGVKLDCGYRMDVLIQKELIIEIKSVEQMLPIHNAQLLTLFAFERLQNWFAAQFQ